MDRIPGAEKAVHLFNGLLTQPIVVSSFDFRLQHDSQIAAILSALSSFNRIAPPYASTILFEMYERNSSEHVLKLFYLNDTYSERPLRWPVPGCEPFEPYYPTSDDPRPGCHVGQFFHAIEDLLPDNWRRECRLDQEATATWMGKGTRRNTTPAPLKLDVVGELESPHEEL